MTKGPSCTYFQVKFEIRSLVLYSDTPSSWKMCTQWFCYCSWQACVHVHKMCGDNKGGNGIQVVPVGHFLNVNVPKKDCFQVFKSACPGVKPCLNVKAKSVYHIQYCLFSLSILILLSPQSRRFSHRKWRFGYHSGCLVSLHITQLCSKDDW